MDINQGFFPAKFCVSKVGSSRIDLPFQGAMSLLRSCLQGTSPYRARAPTPTSTDGKACLGVNSIVKCSKCCPPATVL